MMRAACAYKVAPSQEDEDEPMGCLEESACCLDNGTMLRIVKTSMVALMWKCMAMSSGTSGLSWFCDE